MANGMRWWIILLALTLVLLAARPRADPLERGLSVSDPLVMRHLEAHGFRIDCLIEGVSSSDECRRGTTPASIGNPFFNAPLKEVARKIMQGIVEAQADSLETRGRLNALSYGFPVNFFDDPRATLALVGVINRLDRGFRPPRIKGAKRQDFCGEVRFIYRLGYVEARAGTQYASRLPLTLNVVLRSKTKETPLTCAEVAQSWTWFGSIQPAGFVSDAGEAAKLADALTGSGGPLARVTRAISTASSSTCRSCAFRRPKRRISAPMPNICSRSSTSISETKQFVEAKLENQLDPFLGLCPPHDRQGQPHAAAQVARCRRLIAQNPRFKQRLTKLKRFLFSARGLYGSRPGHDHHPGALYSSFSGVSVAPGGESRFRNGPINPLLGSESQCAGKDRSSYICPDEIALAVKALEAIAGHSGTIRSPRGLIARLNDVSCTGCHQTRAIADSISPAPIPPATCVPMRSWCRDRHISFPTCRAGAPS